MRTVAHRGASALAPENTLRAVEVAIEYRVDLVEVDVHLSRDGQLVVHHDALVRIGERPVPIGSAIAAELREAVVGGERVPLLADLLDLAGSRIGVYVELKAEGTGEALAALVRRGGVATELIGGSFQPSEVSALRRLAPGIPRSVLFRRRPVPEMIDTCRAVAARYAHPCARPIGPGTIAALHAAGLLVMTPHSNDLEEARRFRRAGSDCIASDDPRILAQLREEP